MKPLTKDDFDLDVVEFDSGVYLTTGMEQSEARELVKQILKNQEKVLQLQSDNQALKYERVDLLNRCKTLQEKAEKWDKSCERCECESPNDFTANKNNSDLWNEFVDGEETRLIDTDEHGDAIFLYTTTKKIWINTKIVERLKKRIEELKITNPNIIPTNDDIPKKPINEPYTLQLSTPLIEELQKSLEGKE